MRSIYCIIISIFTLPFYCLAENAANGESQIIADPNVNIVKLAMCQIFCLDGDREGNYVRIENALKRACAQKADIACFPETALLGWVNPAAHESAFPIPGEDSNRLSQLAKKYKIYICIGLAEKSDGKLYDSAILIDDNGQIILKHRKINVLTHLMEPPYAKGDTTAVIDTKFGRVGILICADTFDNNALSLMKEQAPDLLLVPYGWAADVKEWPEHGKSLEAFVRNAAQLIGCTLVGTDLVGSVSNGPYKGKVYGGQSVTSDKYGNIISCCCDRDSDLEIVTHRISD